MIRVWAPRAETVEVVAGDERMPMQRASGGWWELELAPGSAYRVSVDGADPVPDPRSASQPDGVDGPSVVVDHRDFTWTDRAWRGPVPLEDAVFYELHVGTFTPEGTFDGVISRLDHLVGLGVTHVELMPVATFPGTRGWGYDGVLLYAPHHAYGGVEGLKRLVDAAHARGLAVVLDVVYNHLGPAGNHLSQFGPYFTSRYATPWGDAVNLDGAGSDEVRRFFVDNALQWLRDYHVDALRIDAVHALLDTSATHLLEQLAVEVAMLGRPAQLIAESDLNDPRVVSRRAVGGYGIDAQWSDDFHHALHSVLTGERDGYYADFGSLADVATALRDTFVYAGRYSPHRDRVHGRSPAGIPQWRFLGYLQNHDQVGNRARGDRVAASLSRGRLLAGAALVACSPFVPMLFMGEEWGSARPFPYFVDHTDPELADAVRQGRRREFEAFGWDPDDIPDPQDPATAAAAVLDWDAIDADVLAWWRTLLALRASFRGAPAEVELDATAGWLVLRRGEVAVAVNLGSEPVALPIGGQPVVAYPEGAVPGALPPDGVVVLSHASSSSLNPDSSL